MKKLPLLLALIVAASTFIFADGSQRRTSRQRTTKSQSQTISYNSAPAWMQGVWRYSSVVYGRRMECYVGISNIKLAWMIDDDLMYAGPYSIQGDEINFKDKSRANNVIYIDWANQRLTVDKAKQTPFHKL